VHTVLERLDAHGRAADVGRLRVVHVQDAVALGDLLQAMRDAAERRERLGDGVVRNAHGARGGRRELGVLQVVRAAQAHLLGAQRPRRGRPDRHVVLGLVGEDPQLGLAVGLERPVPVEVVLLEVQEDGAIGRELVGVLELERRALADDRRVVAHLADE
jgi:hypothetical protein